MGGYVLKDINVLVVEKQLFMRRLMADVLKQMGVSNVIKVASIEEGLAVFGKMEIDLVLLDWAPDMDAIKFLRTVRNADMSRDPFIPIVVISAYADVDHVFQARDAGMSEYMVKPITAKGLYVHIKSIIERDRHFVKTGDFFGPDRRRRSESLKNEERRSLRLDVQGASMH